MRLPLRGRRTGKGQALVEFSLVLVPFLFLLMGVLDLARAIYTLNGTAEAAREIARVTSVHPFDSCCDLGSGADAQGVIGVQRSLIPGLDIVPSTDIDCVDVSDVVIPDRECEDGDTDNARFVRVTVRAAFAPVTPLVQLFGDHTFESVSRIEIP
jgi:hypothetical protein